MENLLISIVGSLISSIILGLLAICFCIKPYREHRKIYSKIMRLNRQYSDPRDNGIFEPSVNFKQLDEIIEIIDDLNNQKELHPIFSYLFCYKNILCYINLLFDYSRDPIMLAERKNFEPNYLIN